MMTTNMQCSGPRPCPGDGQLFVINPSPVNHPVQLLSVSTFRQLADSNHFGFDGLMVSIFNLVCLSVLVQV